MSIWRELGKAVVLADASTLVTKGVERPFEPPKPVPSPPTKPAAERRASRPVRRRKARAT